MSPALKRLIAHVLDLAVDEFVHHSCDDFDLDKHLPPDEALAFARAALASDDDAAQYAHPTKVVGAWLVMQHGAALLRNEAVSLAVPERTFTDADEQEVYDLIRHNTETINGGGSRDVAQAILETLRRKGA